MVSRILYLCMIACAGINSLECTNRWPERTTKDLQAVDDAISKDRNLLNTCMDKAELFQDCMSRAQQVRALSDYKAVLTYYVSHLDDDRLQLTFCRHEKMLYWPGFIITYDHGRYMVSYVSDRYKCSCVPPQGAQLIACDGIPVDTYMADYIIPYARITEKSYARQVADLCVYDQNLWAHKISYCTYLVDGAPVMVPVVWSRRSRRYLIDHIYTVLKDCSENLYPSATVSKQLELPSKSAILTICRE